MENSGNSIFSLLILLFIFFVAPSLLKMLGQHSLKSKQEPHKDEKTDTGEIIIENPPEEEHPYHLEKPEIIQDPSNKPIKPKMF